MDSFYVVSRKRDYYTNYLLSTFWRVCELIRSHYTFKLVYLLLIAFLLKPKGENRASEFFWNCFCYTRRSVSIHIHISIRTHIHTYEDGHNNVARWSKSYLFHVMQLDGAVSVMFRHTYIHISTSSTYFL